MLSRNALLLVTVVTAQLLQAECGLKILSFNIENFSSKKLQDQPVVDVLLKVLKNYDLILLLEMEDANNEVLQNLVVQLNTITGDYFDKIESGPLRRPTNNTPYGRPEEYAFIYRKDKVQILDHYQSQNHQAFYRPPFSILVKATELDLKFFLVPIHTKPNITVKEIDALPEAFKIAAEVFGTQTGVILGDLNCGCLFVSKKRYEELRLKIDPSFYWWIKHDEDTTTKRNHSCPYNAYDRIITHEGLTEHVVKGSAGVVHFDEQLGLDYNMTRKVSDHYPVTITLTGK